MQTRQLSREGGTKLLEVHEDNPERFFGRSPFKVSSADLWRWKAACEALRELEGF